MEDGIMENKNINVELNLDQLKDVAGGRLLTDTETMDMENCGLRFSSWLNNEMADSPLKEDELMKYYELQDRYAQFIKKQRVNSPQVLFSDFLRKNGFDY